MFKGTKMNEFKTKALSKVDSVKKKASLAAFTTGVALEATGIPVFAAGGSTDANGSVLELADMLINIFPLIGVFFVIAGAFKLFMAYRGNNPEDQSGAAKDIVIGAVFIAFRVFAWPAIKSVIG